MNVKQVVNTILKDMDLEEVKLNMNSFEARTDGVFFAIGRESNHGMVLYFCDDLHRTLNQANQVLIGKHVEELGYEDSIDAVQLQVILHEIGHAHHYVKVYNKAEKCFNGDRDIQIRDLEMKLMEMGIFMSNLREDRIKQQEEYNMTPIEKFANDFADKHYKTYYDLFIDIPEEEIA
jgi:hypothetical protein